MLELIVLGQIPGTELQITFPQVLIITLCLLIIAFMRLEVTARRRLMLKFMNFRQLKKLINQLSA